MPDQFGFSALRNTDLCIVVQDDLPRSFQVAEFNLLCIDDIGFMHPEKFFRIQLAVNMTDVTGDNVLAF